MASPRSNRGHQHTFTQKVSGLDRAQTVAKENPCPGIVCEAVTPLHGRAGGRPAVSSALCRRRSFSLSENRTPPGIGEASSQRPGAGWTRGLEDDRCISKRLKDLCQRWLWQSKGMLSIQAMHSQIFIIAPMRLSPRLYKKENRIYPILTSVQFVETT